MSSERLSSSSWLAVGDMLCLPTTLYWAASLVVLLLRTHIPSFAALTEYGGRQPDTTNAAASLPSQNTILTHGLDLLRRSSLGRCRVSRQDAFTGFYVSGLLTCAALAYACPVCATSLYLFGVHCAVRLAECLFGRRRRAQGEDEVTLFAAVAGCTFYVFASISSCPFRTGTWIASAPRSAHFAVVAVYMAICLGQVYCHAVLRRLRAHPDFEKRRHDSATASPSPSQSPRPTPARDEKIWLYHFPQVFPFTWVQEPHYLAELMLYAIQALILLPAHSRSLPEGTSRAFLNVLQFVMSWAVLTFTGLNLGITATQHRQFWLNLNAERRRLRATDARDPARATVLPPPPERLPHWLLVPLVY